MVNYINRTVAETSLNCLSTLLGVIALILRIGLVGLSVIVTRNFGKGLKEKGKYSTSDLNDSELKKKRENVMFKSSILFIIKSE